MDCQKFKLPTYNTIPGIPICMRIVALYISVRSIIGYFDVQIRCQNVINVDKYKNNKSPLRNKTYKTTLNSTCE